MQQLAELPGSHHSEMVVVVITPQWGDVQMVHFSPRIEIWDTLW